MTNIMLTLIAEANVTDSNFQITLFVAETKNYDKTTP